MSVVTAAEEARQLITFDDGPGCLETGTLEGMKKHHISTLALEARAFGRLVHPGRAGDLGSGPGWYTAPLNRPR